VYAVAAKASLVHSVDISESAISACERNMELNFRRTNIHRAIIGDCFDYLRKMSERYDVVILDPPAFAKSKAAVDRAARGYKDINLYAAKGLAEDGILFTFSCSQHISAELFQKIVFGALLDAGREASILYKLQQPIDHPVSIYHPEGSYLKGLVLRVK
jgi:23S rRNA (cytosine1962-C5)-methyltransferase